MSKMPKKLAATLLLIAAVSAPICAEEFQADPHFASGDEAKELLAEGVNHYLSGDPAKAAVSFQNVLKLNPDNKLLYEFYLAVGDNRLIRMQETDQLSDVLKEILRKARIYQKDLRHSPEYIKLMIDKLEKSEEERVVATNELVAIGPLSVPHLVARMNDNRQDLIRVYCRIALTKMGYRAVVPLVESLNAKDERQVESVIMVLADIGDPRALPKLKQLEEQGSGDTVKRVLANALASIQKKNAMDKPRPVAAAPVAKDPKKKAPTKDDAAAAQATADSAPQPLPSAEKLYYLEAARYFRGDARVQDEVGENESLMWRWNEDAADAAAKLTFVKVPRYAWNELMAEELLFDAMDAYPQFGAFAPLLAADIAALDVETQRRARLAKERTSPTDAADEQSASIEERLIALSEISLRVRMFGPENLYRGIQQAIVSERYDVAAYCMRLLEDKYLADAERLLPSKAEGLTSDKAGTVLVAALDHADKMVRYQAATTLARLDPALRFFNAEKVVPILADAVGEWGMRVVVVLDQDYRQRNTAREHLQRQGYLVYTAVTGFDLMQRIAEAPVKDAIIIAGDLLPSIKDEFGASIDVPEQKAESLVEKLKADGRAEKTPVFISLPEDAAQAAKIQTAFEGKVTGFVRKPFAGADLEGQIEAALKDGQVSSVNHDAAEEISLRAAQALAAVDPARCQYDLSAAGESLLAALDKRADPIRIAALQALGICAQHPKGEALRGQVTKVTDVYGSQDATLTPEVRAAFLDAIGQLDPLNDAAVAILKQALAFTDGDAGKQLLVRTAAANAVGHATKTPNELLRDYQKQQRLDVRAPGNGQAKQ
ncbi:MAG: HEAT repeat domain-containing protein [Planctomycetes bacterium]|nr:HEAT repeat domain-containing protein [Planctomycetota bacterium]